jgi:glycosyltransferase involved in cell wall biosynthesis
MVMTPVGAAPQVIGRNERGRLVPIGESEPIAAALIELGTDGDLGRSLGEAGRAYIREHFCGAATARRYEALYRKALDEKSTQYPRAGGAAS